MRQLTSTISRSSAVMAGRRSFSGFSSPFWDQHGVDPPRRSPTAERMPFQQDLVAGGDAQLLQTVGDEGEHAPSSPHWSDSAWWRTPVAMLATPPSTRWQEAACSLGGAVAGAQGHDQAAQTGGLGIEAVEGGLTSVSMSPARRFSSSALTALARPT